ncbi:cytochrome c biogenesis CcdA family protein [Candidatus Amarobacter glycogenicus]|uniref:cytochrome c biogenesis CcdA family protein n=2 Tax=Candidatus Amarobacter glycogenicus TaxID=3140699 RepID=UPI002A0DA7EF|nr:cytochrome c biogenesis protein CcdA [Dehalococcoidia bacterium]
MATQRVFGRSIGSRSTLYVLFAALVLIPVVAFAIGPLGGSSLSLEGPGGPFLAFSAGVLSFVSPCVLPMVPIFIAQVSGSSIQNGNFTADRRVTFTHAVAFVSGLSLVFIALGAAAGLVGSYFLVDNQRELGDFAGAVLVFMGVLVIPPRGRADPLKSAFLLVGLTGIYFFLAEVAELKDDRTRLVLLGAVLLAVWLRFAGYLQLTLFSRTFEVRIATNQPIGYLRSAFVGGAFGLGWTPCVGPILGSILTLAADSGGALRGTHLLAWYALGLSIPFLITGLAISDVNRFLRRIQPYGPVIEVVSGLMLIGVGVLLISGRLTGLNELFSFADFNQGL